MCAQIQELVADMDTLRGSFRAKEDAFSRLSMEWQDLQSTKARELDSLKEQVNVVDVDFFLVNTQKENGKILHAKQKFGVRA